MSEEEDITIGKRFKKFRNEIDQSQEVLALELNVSQSYIAGIESGRNKVPQAAARHMLHRYDMSLNWLFNGIGPMYVHEPVAGSKKVTSKGNLIHENGNLIAEDVQAIYKTRQNVIMVPVAAQAGILGNWTQEWINQNLLRTSLPGINQESFAFEVEGLSMVPTVHPGDFVVGRKLEKGEEIRDSRVHIIISRSSGIYIKRAYLDKDCIILESDNDSFPPVALPNDDVHMAFYAIQRITGNFSGPRPFSSRVDRIEDYLANRFPDFRNQDDQA